MNRRQLQDLRKRMVHHQVVNDVAVVVLTVRELQELLDCVEKQDEEWEPANTPLIDSSGSLDPTKDVWEPINVVGHLTKEERLDLYKRAAEVDEVSGGEDDLDEDHLWWSNEDWEY